MIHLHLEIANEFVFNNPDTSKFYVLTALKRAEITKDTLSQAKATNLLGVIFYEQGKLLTALENYQRSQFLYKSVNDLPGVLEAMNNIGTVYRDLDDVNRAIEIYEEAFRINSNLNETEGAASNLFNMVNSFLEKGDLKQAKENLHRLRELYSDHSGEMNLRALSAEVFLKEGNLDSALVSVDSALLFCTKKGDEYALANLLLSKAEILRQKQLPDEAVRHLQISGRLIKKNGFRKLELNYLSLLSEIYADGGLFQQAFKIQKRKIQLSDSLDNDNNSRRISELNAKYEADRREAEIINQQTMINNKTAQFRFALAVGIALVIIAGLVIFNLVKKRRLDALLKIQNAEIRYQGQKILSSINYARRIQNAILPKKSLLEERFDESFIYFRPKDIVSGDFYWMRILDNKLYLAVIDCTGHGVPGAFMSIIANSKMNAAVHEFGLREPAEIVLSVHRQIVEMLHQEDSEVSLQDGLDMALCTIDFEKKIINYCGANSAIHLLSAGIMTEYKTSPVSVGGTVFSRYFNENKNPFDSIELEFSSGDFLFMHTDGIVDQVCGEKNKKLNKKAFRELLSKLASLSLNDAEFHCDEYIENWKQGAPQTDDMLLLALRF
ncbi:MAG: tetratricopeptide repeat protein [Crocinitomicaceae bacterium]|nr:tetratricopeptide repeat protein [Crocinitomicaceae bacterium]